MQDEPTPTELTKSVADFLRNDIAPLISGHQAFKLRVAINMLDLVTRQLTLEEGSDAKEVERLRALLGIDGSVTEPIPRDLSIVRSRRSERRVFAKRLPVAMGPGLRRDDSRKESLRTTRRGALRRQPYFPSHFGGRFSENAFGPST
ncbi:DUF6285 domain-containing protein [Bradyrhizobium sp. P5_C11_2]